MLWCGDYCYVILPYLTTGCRGMEAYHIRGGTRQPHIHGLLCIVFTNVEHMHSMKLWWVLLGCRFTSWPCAGLHNVSVCQAVHLFYSGKSHLPPSFKLVICTVCFMCTLGRSVEEVGQAGVSWSGQCREDYPLEYAKGRQNGTTCTHTASKYVGHLVCCDVYTK